MQFAVNKSKTHCKVVNITFGNVFYLAFLGGRQLHFIKHMANAMHIMYINRNILKFAKSNPGLVSEKLISSKYHTH